MKLQDIVPRGYSSDERMIWECLIHRDYLAFAKADWSIIQNDFLESSFYGMSAAHHSDKSKWTLSYPDLNSYRRDWLRDANDMKSKNIDGDLYEILLSIGKLTKIEIHEDLAVVTKRFDGACPIIDEEAVVMQWTSFFSMRKIYGQWRTESFIGYIPN